MKQRISRSRFLKFLWRRRKPLWEKTKRFFAEVHEELKTKFDIPQTKAAWYKIPRAFLISVFGWSWVEWTVERGYKRLTLFCIKLLPHDNLDAFELERIIKKYPSIRSIECIVAATLTRAPETVDKIYEYVACRRLHYYSNLLTDHAHSEKAYISLIKWRHNDILQRIEHKYDPTFLCWVALLFDRKHLFEQKYSLSDHDKLVHMIEYQFYSMEHDCIAFPTDKKEKILELLMERQREKLTRCVSHQGDTKKRKM